LALYSGWAAAAAIRTLGHVKPALEIPSIQFAIQLAVGNAIIAAMLPGLIVWLLPIECNLADESPALPR
jgi:hypothetical protein